MYPNAPTLTLVQHIMERYPTSHGVLTSSVKPEPWPHHIAPGTTEPRQFSFSTFRVHPDERNMWDDYKGWPDPWKSYIIHFAVPGIQGANIKPEVKGKIEVRFCLIEG